MAKQIRFIGGAWRVIDGQNVESSYSTYADALKAGKASIESQEPTMTSDDIQAQFARLTASSQG